MHIKRQPSKGDFEIRVPRVGGDFPDLGFSQIAGEGFFDVPYAIINIIKLPLGKHFDIAVRQVSDEAGELIAIGYSVGGESKADALNTTDEDYVFGNHFSYCALKSAVPYRWHGNLKRTFVQANVSATNKGSPRTIS